MVISVWHLGTFQMDMIFIVEFVVPTNMDKSVDSALKKVEFVGHQPILTRPLITVKIKRDSVDLTLIVMTSR